MIKTKKIKPRSNELETLKAQLARALADYDNLQKRVEKEREDYRKVVGIALIMKMLPIVDMLEEALDQTKDSGIAIVLKELEDVLSEEGVSRIDTKPGVKFDEEVHDAVDVVEDKSNKGKIVEVVLSGWIYEDGSVVRPTKVKVGK